MNFPTILSRPADLILYIPSVSRVRRPHLLFADSLPLVYSTASRYFGESPISRVAGKQQLTNLLPVCARPRPQEIYLAAANGRELAVQGTTRQRAICTPSASFHLPSAREGDERAFFRFFYSVAALQNTRKTTCHLTKASLPFYSVLFIDKLHNDNNNSSSSSSSSNDGKQKQCPTASQPAQQKPP